MDKDFGFTRLETRPLEEIAKVDLDNLPLEESSSAYALTVCSLPQYASKEPMEEAFCVWPGGGLWSPSMTEESPQGEALMRFQEVGCSEARKAPCYPPILGSPDDCDLGAKGLDEGELPEKLVRKNADRKQPPRFTLPTSLEYTMRWKELRWRKSSRIKATSTPRRLIGSWR